MPKVFIAAALLLGLGSTQLNAAPAEPRATETIVLVRHAEKPPGGLGQLDCQGLNRALALPAVISREFGRPDAILAPDPAAAKADRGVLYDYVRPLATVEPTAIAFGLPVDASIGFSDVRALAQKLDAPDYRGGLVLVAWEHAAIVETARLLMAEKGGDPRSVPDWQADDFDSIFIVWITRGGGHASAAFERRHEGLDGLPETCPGQPPARMPGSR
jgi:hypothetical protein